MGREPTPSSTVPAGLQELLRLAQVHRAFCDLLVADRSEMAGHAGVALTASEWAILNSMPESRILEMIGALPPLGPRRSAALLGIATRAVELARGGGPGASSREGSEPIALPRDAAWADAAERLADARPDERPMVYCGGIAPDMPPERASRLGRPYEIGPLEAESAQRPDSRERTWPGLLLFYLAVGAVGAVLALLRASC